METYKWLVKIGIAVFIPTTLFLVGSSLIDVSIYAFFFVLALSIIGLFIIIAGIAGIFMSKKDDDEEAPKPETPDDGGSTAEDADPVKAKAEAKAEKKKAKTEAKKAKKQAKKGK